LPKLEAPALGSTGGSGGELKYIETSIYGRRQGGFVKRSDANEDQDGIDLVFKVSVRTSITSDHS
jgi:hypothetical protein